MPIGFLEIVVLILLVWTLVITFFFLRFYLFYMKIKKGTKEESLIPILNDLLGREKRIAEGIVNIDKRVRGLEDESQFYIQKIGMIRFNPFNDTGGDQSFIIALLDASDTGVVISSLHTRTGTRWYAKKIIEGKGAEHQLSEEELSAIAKSKKLSKK